MFFVSSVSGERLLVDFQTPGSGLLRGSICPVAFSSRPLGIAATGPLVTFPRLEHGSDPCGAVLLWVIMPEEIHRIVVSIIVRPTHIFRIVSRNATLGFKSHQRTPSNCSYH